MKSRITGERSVLPLCLLPVAPAADARGVLLVPGLVVGGKLDRRDVSESHDLLITITSFKSITFYIFIIPCTVGFFFHLLSRNSSICNILQCIF